MKPGLWLLPGSSLRGASTFGPACAVAGVGSADCVRPLAVPLRKDTVAARRRLGADAPVEEEEGGLRREAAGPGCDSFEEVEMEESGRKERVDVLSTRVERGRAERNVEERFGAGRVRVESVVVVVGLRRDWERDRPCLADVEGVGGILFGLAIADVGGLLLRPSNLASASEFDAMSLSS